MLAGGNFYPYSCKPEDVWAALEKDRETCFYRCAGAGRVSGLLCPRIPRKGVTIDKAPGDDEILKTPSILSLSAITPRAAPRRR